MQHNIQRRTKADFQEKKKHHNLQPVTNSKQDAGLSDNFPLEAKEFSFPSKTAVYDFLIIGQGLCGTFLSYYLLKAGKNVLVIDESKLFTASKVASGVINPVTGRRIVRTWRIEELLPFAKTAYSEIGEVIQANIIKDCSVLDFHPTAQMKEAFEKRLPEEREFLHQHSLNWSEYFNYHFGVSEIRPCFLIDLNTLMASWRKKLIADDSILNERFDIDSCVISNDNISYKGITAKKIIFCDGADGASNPYFKNLPYSSNKGEAIIASIPGLSKNHIYKQGLSIVPWKDDLFWIGSTYEWNFTNAAPTPAFKEKVTSELNYWLKIPYKIVDHLASIRPANMERRPFVGLHPKFTSVGILNGMGTKGCSIAPFFAKQLAEHLVFGKEIYADADLKRFEKTLAREMN